MKNDAENIRILEQARPRYDGLRTAQIKLSAEVERVSCEIADKEVQSVEAFGTSDPEGLNNIITDAWADNTSAVQEFVDVVNSIYEEYTKLAGAPEQVAITRPQAPSNRTPPQR